MTTTHELLEEAKRVLITDGWCQNAYHLDGQHCLAGALDVASENLGSSKWSSSQADAYRVLLNDKATTTFNDVMSMLDKAILHTKEEEWLNPTQR